MSLHRPVEGSSPLDPASRGSASHEERRESRSSRLAGGTLSCPRCDAPPLPPQRALSPMDSLGCGFCLHEAPVRDFLTLGDPARPTKVSVHVRTHAPLPRRRTARSAG